MSTIAGHEFIEQPYGRACRACGKKWLDVLATREYWRPGETGIAHVGALNQLECDQLYAEVERIWGTLRAGVEA